MLFGLTFSMSYFCKMEFLTTDLEAALEILRNGGLILYPTDTVWGIGCDATNPEAIARIYQLKKRSDRKSMIILLADERDLLQYVAAPDMEVWNFLDQAQKPTTVIYENALSLPENLVNEDGSIGIRIVKETFCKHLIKRLGKPIVSTSANISGEPTAPHFSQISPQIIQGVDYVVKYRQEDTTPTQPSSVVKWNDDGTLTVLRP